MVSSDVRQFHAANQHRQFNNKKRKREKKIILWGPDNSENDMLRWLWKRLWKIFFNADYFLLLCDYWHVYFNTDYNFMNSIRFEKVIVFYKTLIMSVIKNIV